MTGPAATIVPELLTTAEAARLCGIGERTLWRLSRSGMAPPPTKIGGSVRYRRREYLDWIAGGCRPVDPGMAAGDGREAQPPERNNTIPRARPIGGAGPSVNNHRRRMRKCEQ